MKKIFYFTVFALIVSLIFPSCKKDENPVNQGGTTNNPVTKNFRRFGLNKTIAGNNAFTFDTLDAPVTIDNILSNYTADISLNLDTITGIDVTKLKFVLIHQGTGVLVIDTLVNSGTGFIGTVLSDSATVPIISGNGTYTGLFKPQRPFALFRNLPAEGQYILRIFNSGTLKSGVIKSWGITVTYNQLVSSNYCLEFNGSNNFVQVPDNVSLNSMITNNTFTLEGWYKILGFPNYNYFSFLDKQNSWYCEYSRLDSTWTLVAPGVNTAKSAKYPVNLNTWHHFAVTYDGLNNSIKFYIDGNFLSESTLSLSFVQRSTSLYIANGISGAQEFGNGRLDEIRIWNVVRNATDIYSNYNKSLVGNETGLVLYYKFSEGMGSQVYDVTSNGNNGILVNNPQWSTDGPTITP
jgi:hypothetical protein